MENKIYERVRTFDELLEREYGEIGTPGRNQYEENAQMFIIGEMLQNLGRHVGLTFL